MPENTLTAARALADQICAWRRYLHARPELSGQERETSEFVCQQLRELGLEPRTGVGGGFGLTATLHIDDRPAVALRGDMDALPIREETGVDYASRNPGAMHACGHDAHTAMLLGAAALLTQWRDRLKRSVKLIFQPHEELYPGGAAAMIADGALADVAVIFGIHISSNLPTGQLGTRPGPIMSAVNEIDIEITGRGGHAAMPELCIDPVLAAAQVVVALQSAVSRAIAMTDSAVVSVTQFHAGTAHNIIPERVRLNGTIRTLDEGVRGRVCARVSELARAISTAHGASADVNLSPGYPVLVNDAGVVENALETARRVGFTDDRLVQITPQGGGEDFAYYCQKVPGAFAFLGARNEAKNCVYPHHHPRFNIDEDALASGAALLCQFAVDAGER